MKLALLREDVFLKLVPSPYFLLLHYFLLLLFRFLQDVLLRLCLLKLSILYRKKQEILILLNLEPQRPLNQPLAFQLNHPLGCIRQGYEISRSYVIATLIKIYNSVHYPVIYLRVVNFEELLSGGCWGQVMEVDSQPLSRWVDLEIQEIVGDGFQSVLLALRGGFAGFFSWPAELPLELIRTRTALRSSVLIRIRFTRWRVIGLPILIIIIPMLVIPTTVSIIQVHMLTSLYGKPSPILQLLEAFKSLRLVTRIHLKKNNAQSQKVKL